MYAIITNEMNETYNKINVVTGGHPKYKIF